MVRLDVQRWLGGNAQSEIDQLNTFDQSKIAAMRAAMIVAKKLLDWRNGDGVLNALLHEHAVVLAQPPKPTPAAVINTDLSYLPSDWYEGHKPGYVWKKGANGTGVKGYYIDPNYDARFKTAEKKPPKWPSASQNYHSSYF